VVQGPAADGDSGERVKWSFRRLGAENYYQLPLAPPPPESPPSPPLKLSLLLLSSLELLLEWSMSLDPHDVLHDLFLPLIKIKTKIPTKPTIPAMTMTTTHPGDRFEELSAVTGYSTETGCGVAVCKAAS